MIRLKYNSNRQVLRLLHPDGWREILEDTAEVVLGKIIFYVQVWSYNVRSKVALLHSEDLDPETNQEVAFLVRSLRGYSPRIAIIGRRIEMDENRIRRLWLQSLRQLDQSRAARIKEFLQSGGVKEYL